MHAALRSTFRELQVVVGMKRMWLVFLAILALFVATGPFATLEKLDLAARLGYWLIVQSIAWSIALFFVNLFDVLLQGRIDHPLMRMMIGAAVASIPMGLALMPVHHAFLDAPLTVGETAENVLITLPISLAICFLTWTALEGTRLSPPEEKFLAEASRSPGSSAAEARTTLARPSIIDRLPANKRGPVLRLESQDHYVLIVTSRGSELVLMRLSDAVGEVPEELGIRIHRSHWVAYAAMETLEREPGKNGRSHLLTKDGARLPVSRQMLPILKRRLTG